MYEKHLSIIAGIVLSAAAVGCSGAPTAAAASNTPSPDMIAHGKQLISVGGCGDCHTPMTFNETLGMPLPDLSRKLSGHPAEAADPEAAPGRKDQAVIGATFTSFRAPFGVVYAANLTPDTETGLGKWTADDFIATMRTGHEKGTGRMLLPPMPWQNMSGLPDADLRAMFGYLQSLPAVHNRVPAPKVSPETIASLEKSLAAAALVPH